MNARDEILARIRQALDGTDAHPSPVPRGYRRAAAPASDESIETFVERLTDYGAVVVRCSHDQISARIADALPADKKVLVPDDLPWEVAGAVPDSGFTSYELDRFDAVVTTAALGIAETGTIVLGHGPGEGRRAITLVPDLHVCVISADRIVADVPDAVRLTDASRPSTWISGPSATSDIELQRVQGVHGPRTLHVIVAIGRATR